MTVWQILKDLWSAKKPIVVVAVPLLFLPLPILYDSKEVRCAYGMSIMAVFWITESLPVSVTGLLPIIIFPLLGVLPIKQVCPNYMKDTALFGLGCLSFALAVETWNLHKRVALKTLLLVGSNPKWLMLGFMMPTWFISMWVNNTSATAMMIPIVDAVLNQLREVEERRETSSTDELEIPLELSADGILTSRDQNTQRRVYDERYPNPAFRDLCKGLTLCVAYAANIGGTGSLSGTGTNLVLKGQVDMVFEEYGLESGVTFVTWMIFALPGSILCVTLGWLWLSFHFLGRRKWFNWKCHNNESDRAVKRALKEQYKELGPVSFAEKGIMLHFVVLVILWLSRKPPVVKGWGSYFPYAGDSVAAILICISLFICPSRRPQVFCFKKTDDPVQSVPALLDWTTIQRSYPWGLLMLMGGGYALADACEKSGLSRWIGGELTALGFLEPWVMNLILTLAISFCTEITSNAAMASLLLPIVAQLAIKLSIHPLYLMLSCTVCTSFAFMLPVATPPNTIVFSNGHLQVKDMIIAGVVMNFLCVFVLNIAINTWAFAFFDLGVIPPAFRINATLTETILQNATAVS